MKARIKHWQRRAIRHIAPGELVVTGWRFAALCVLRPVCATRYGWSRFRCWSCLPGDVFEDFQRDACYVVIRPRPREVECVIVTNQLLKHPERYGIGAFTAWNGKIILQPATFDHSGIRPVVVTETIPRERMRSWTPPTKDQRRRSREMALVP